MFIWLASLNKSNIWSYKTFSGEHLLYVFSVLSSVKADLSQKASEESESAAGLGPDLTASVETTYSEQSSSSASSASSSDQPIYFRYRISNELTEN